MVRAILPDFCDFPQHLPALLCVRLLWEPLVAQRRWKFDLAAGRKPVRSAACPLPPPRPGRFHPQSSTLRQTETFRRPFGPTRPAPRLRTMSLRLARFLRCRVLDDGYEIASLSPFSVLLHPCPVLPRLQHQRRGRCELSLVNAMIRVLRQNPRLYDHLVPQLKLKFPHSSWVSTRRGPSPVSSRSPLRTGLATLMASGSAPLIDLHGGP